MTPLPPPLKIWHVNIGNHAGPVDGVAAAATRLASEQASAGHDVRLIVAADPAFHEGIRETAGRDLELTLAPSARDTLHEAYGLLDDLRSRPDVMHLHSVFRPAHRLLALRARRRGVPIVLSPHAGLAPDLRRRDRFRKWAYGRLVERRFYRTADGVHTLQLVEHADVVDYCGADRTTAVVPNPVAPELLHAEPWKLGTRTPHRTGGRVILLCRYDVYQKGLDVLARIAGALPAAEFCVYGSTDKNQPERAEALIADAPPNLRFEPPIHGEEKLKALREADLFLQPSRVEGLSVALVEAMTLGVPCGVSQYVGRSLTMQENGTALVLHSEPAIAAGQIGALLGNPRKLAALGRAARDYATRFTPEAVTRSHLEHYEKLLGRRQAPTEAPRLRTASPNRSPS